MACECEGCISVFETAGPGSTPGQATMKAEFICNVPALEDYSCYAELGAGCNPRIFVDVDPKWTRVGNVLIGPPYGANPIVGDVGLYEICQTT